MLRVQGIKKNKKASLICGLAASLAILVLCGCQGIVGDPPSNTTPGSGTLQSVNHIIFMLQENRSFDHYFGKMTAYRAANGIPGTVEDLDSGRFSNSGIAPYHSGSVCMENLTPDWSEMRHQLNVRNPTGVVPGDPKTMPMDGFVNIAAAMAVFNGFLDTAGRRTMSYYTEHELNYYYFMAANFAMGDAFYSPAPTNTPNNRIFGMGATSQGTVHEPGGDESCPGERTQISSKPIFQVLSEHNISWKIYITDLQLGCDPKNGEFPLDCAARSTYLQFFRYISGNSLHPPVKGLNPEVLKHMAPLDCSGATPRVRAHPPYTCPAGVTDYFTDVTQGTLPAVAFIESGGASGRDEHPSGRDISVTPPIQRRVNLQHGAQLVSQIINALMTSPSWKDSAFFWAIDEGGGAFDHVPPMAVPNPDGIKPILCLDKDVSVGGDFTISGYRVPNFIVSPFAKKNYVSHTPMDYTAWLKFVETRWNLPSLTQRDAAMPDMQEFFDFAGAPWATPPVPPKQVSTGTPCDFSKQ